MNSRPTVYEGEGLANDPGGLAALGARERAYEALTELGAGGHGLAAGLLAELAVGGDGEAIAALAEVAAGRWTRAIELLAALAQVPVRTVVDRGRTRGSP